MSWVESRSSQQRVRTAGLPAGAARMRRRRSSTCIQLESGCVQHDASPEPPQLLSGKQMFEVIRRLSREKTVTVQLARQEIEKAFESGYSRPPSVGKAPFVVSPRRDSSVRKPPAHSSMKLPARLRSPISSSKLTKRVEKPPAASGSRFMSELNSAVKKQDSGGAPTLNVTPAAEETAESLANATVTRSRSSSVDRISLRIRSSDNNSLLLEEVQDMVNMSNSKTTLLSNFTSKFKRKKQKKKTTTSLIEAGSGAQLPGQGAAPAPSPAPVIAVTDFPPPKFSPRDAVVKRFPTPKFSSMGRTPLPDIGPPPADRDVIEQLVEEESVEEDGDGDLKEYTVRARNSRRCSGIPKVEKITMAHRAMNVSKKNLQELNAVQVDEMDRYEGMPAEEFVSLVIMGLNSFAAIACDCLDGRETVPDTPPEVSLAEESATSEVAYDGVTKPLKNLILRLYRFMRFILRSLVTESVEHLDCSKHILCVLKDTALDDIGGVVEGEFFETIRIERSAVTARVCNNLKTDAHADILQLMTHGVYLCSLFAIKKASDAPKKAARDDGPAMAALFAARGVIDLIDELVDKIAAVTVFTAMLDLQIAKEESLSSLGHGLVVEPDNINVYDEMLHDHTGSGLATEESSSSRVMCSCHLPEGADTINSIICAITDPSGEHSLEFVKMIITTHSAFTTPWGLFSKLWERFCAPQDLPSAFAVGLRVGAVLKQWLKLSSSDFDPQLLMAVRQFLQEEMMLTHKEMAEHLLQTVEETCSEQSWTVKPCKTIPVLNPRTLLENPFDITAPILNHTVKEFADQITLCDRNIFVGLDVKALLNQAWTKVGRQHVTRGLLRIIDRLNQCSHWVASVILAPATLSKRIKVLTKLVRLGDALRKMHNFMGLAYVVFGLSQASICRLKFTVGGLSKSTKKTLAELQDVMDPTSSYKNYRAALATASPPVLPFCGVKLSDLTMIDEGNPTFLEGEFEDSPALINVEKQEMVYNVLSDMTMFMQSCEYDIVQREPLYSYCEALPHLNDEDELYFLSRDREPPKASASDIK